MPLRAKIPAIVALEYVSRVTILATRALERALLRAKILAIRTCMKLHKQLNELFIKIRRFNHLMEFGWESCGHGSLGEDGERVLAGIGLSKKVKTKLKILV
jgi:hypothetical protein